ncbi:MAG: stage II sporulation protein M [Planctomycetes bacterium]|nr:stage II sporulation protein M [Planctomycetota bacterium]
MDPDAFLAERRGDWERLEDLLGRAERGSFRALDAEGARALGQLYRRAAADLLRARSRGAPDPVLSYLNQLVARAYGRIYGGRRFRMAAVCVFLARGFPETVRRRWGPVALSAALLAAGVGFGFAATALDPEARNYLLPQELSEIQQLNPGAPFSANMGAMASAYIMTNNIRVCFLAFALGVTLGVGTAWVLVSNGLLLGALAWRAVELDEGLHFSAFILPHGVIELSCIALAGAAGLILGDALLRPGDRTRRDALALHGRDALRLLAGSVPLLVLCGLIEGFLTGWEAIPDEAKVAFGLLSGLLLAFYLVLGDRLLPDHWARG